MLEKGMFYMFFENLNVCYTIFSLSETQPPIKFTFLVKRTVNILTRCVLFIVENRNLYCHGQLVELPSYFKDNTLYIC